jgi:hypothetical protein
MIFLFIAFTGALAAGVIYLLAAWLIDRSAATAYRAEERAWLAGGADVITAFRIELYRRSANVDMPAGEPGRPAPRLDGPVPGRHRHHHRSAA